jgi:hypothetical protein
VLPYWPKERYLELAPKHWHSTREKLNPDELGAPLCSFTIRRRKARPEHCQTQPNTGVKVGPCIGYT